jgi:hypothetical protein
MLRGASLGLFMLLVGCGDDKTQKDPGPTNNSAVLSGAAVGANTASSAELRRVIPVSATGAGFEVGSGYVTRREPADANVYLAVPVKNTTSGLRCAIRAASIAWQDATGQALSSSTGMTSLQGSVGQNGTSFFSTCLQPNEAGYLVDLVPTATVFDSVARVVLSLGAEDQGWTLPEAAVVPTSYSTTATSVTVNYVNSGTAAATVLGSSRYFLLDATGPLGWNFLANDIVPLGPLAPGQTGSSANATLTFASQASKLHAFINFEQ